MDFHFNKNLPFPYIPTHITTNCGFILTNNIIITAYCGKNIELFSLYANVFTQTE